MDHPWQGETEASFEAQHLLILEHHGVIHQILGSCLMLSFSATHQFTESFISFYKALLQFSSTELEDGFRDGFG